LKFEYNEIFVMTIYCVYRYNQMVINYYIVTDILLGVKLIWQHAVILMRGLILI